MSSEESTIEFSVNMTCNKCVGAIQNALNGVKGIKELDVDLEKQSVVLTTTLSTVEVQKKIESTGKRAVVVGLGSRNKKHLGAAVAMLGGTIGAGSVQGVIRFVQSDSYSCLIDGTIDGLEPGSAHALAIHECGDLSGGCGTDRLGGHFNPRNARHGSPVDSEDNRHVGDLGNIHANSDGRAEFRFADKLVKVWDIIGRSIVVASGQDDLGKGGNQMSQVNGNSGSPLSCGIIARSAGLFENVKKFCACDGVTIWDERDKPLAGPGRAKDQNGKL